MRVAASSDRMVCSVPAAPLSHVLGVQPPRRALLCAPLGGLLTRRRTVQLVKGLPGMGTPQKHFARMPCAQPLLANAKRVRLIQLTRLLTRPTLPCSLRLLAGAGEWQVRCSRAGKWA